MSHTIDTRDARKAVELVGDFSAATIPAEQWKIELLRSVRALTGAMVGVLSVHSSWGSGAMKSLTSMASDGWMDEEEQRVAAAFISDPTSHEPMLDLFERIEGPVVVRRRPELLDDRTWYGSRWVQDYRRRMRVDSAMYVSCRIGPGDTTMLLGLHRAWGDPEFTIRDASVAELVHAGMRTAYASRQGQDAFAKLPPHLRGVLDRLLAGDSEKAAAAQLDLSPHTVHQYVKKLYKALGVSSRGELGALALRLNHVPASAGGTEALAQLRHASPALATG